MCINQYHGPRIFLTSKSRVLLSLLLVLVSLFRLWYAVWVVEYNRLFNRSFVFNSRYYFFLLFSLSTAAVSVILRVCGTVKFAASFCNLLSHLEEVA